MKIYLVRLADRITGEGQSIIVVDRNPDAPVEEWVEKNVSRLDPPLKLTSPMVVNCQELNIRRPHKTVLPTAVKELV